MGGKELGPGAASWRSSFISSLIVSVWLPGIKVGISDAAGEKSQSQAVPSSSLCIAESHGKITNQSSDSNKKSG